MFHVRRYVVRAVLPAMLIVSAAVTLVGPLQSVAQAATLPELPRIYLDTTYAPPTGPTISVPAGGDFQGALNTAQPGSVIVLQAGATYAGNFTLPVTSGTGWIYIQSSALSSLPVPGIRVTPAQAALMPKVVGNPALGMGSGAHHYRFIGVEFITPVSGSVLTLLDVNGTDIVFDRCYIHARPGQDARTGVMVNGRRTAVIDSYLSEWHHRQFDSSAIWGFNGPGPFKFVNNYLEGSGVNLFFGGTDASSSANMPSDIEIRGNYLFKPLSWKVGDPSYAGVNWVVKNIFELKNAQRVLIEGNIFENSWTGNMNSQGGFGVQFTPRNQYGGNPWATVRDVTFVRNVIRRATGGIFFLGWDDIQSNQEPLRRVLVKDNLLLEIGAFPDVVWGFFTGMLFDLKNRPEDVTIDHNTAFHTASPLYGQYGAAPRLTYTNNIVLNNNGVRGDGTSTPSATFSTYFPDAVFARNALVGAAATGYPVDNFLPTTLDLVGFVSYAAGDYRLSVASPYKYLGLDGKDPGADIDALAAATATAISGTGSTPADSTPPAVTLTSPLAGTVSGTVTISATATDNTSVVGVQFRVNGANYGAEDTTNSYSISWDTATVSNGSYSLTAMARDGAGNQGISPAITVTVSNVAADTTPPVISSVAASSVTSSGAGITWTTGEASDSQVEYGVSTSYGSATPLATNMITAHAVTLGGLTPATIYHYRVRSADAAGNAAVSGDFTVTTAPVAVPTQSPFTSTPSSVPGQIEAEDFDNGGEGVAYHDLTSGNQGGFYRTDVGVDIRQQSDGGVIVFNFQTGEWLEYTIQVATTGTYRLELLVSNQGWSPTPRWHAEIDGATVTSSIQVPNTGSWNTFRWAGPGGIALTAGQHVLRIVADQEYFGFAALRFRISGTPYKGTPAAAPGQIEAEDFDNGGEGVAYHDLTAGNQGGFYRTDVGVDIRQQPDGGVIIFNFQTGEWLEYTIQVATTGTYRLELLVSNQGWSPTPRWHGEIDGATVTSSIQAPNTGSWSTFQWAGPGGIALTAGQHVLRIAADQEYFGFAALRLVAQ